MADDDALAPVYLIGGDDRDKVRRALDRLRARYAGDAVEEVDATADEPETAVARCRQQGLFATERLVVVDHLEAWVRPKRAGRLDPLLDYLAEPDPSAVLVLVEDAPADPKKPLLAPDDPMVRAIVKVSGKQGVLRFQAAKGAAFARTEAERLGVALDPESLRLFGDLMGDRPAEISRELDKLSTWAMGDPVEVSTVRLLVAGRGDDAPWSLLDAITERDRRRALAELVRLLEGGAEPHRLLPQVTRHVQYLRETVLLAERGRPTRDALAKRLGIAPFRAGKMLAAIGVWTPARTGYAVRVLQGADADMKGFSRQPPALVLERGLALAL